MIGQLVFTSAPRGLEAGKYGYCTVARTRSLSARLVRLVEGWSYWQEFGQQEEPIHVFRKTEVNGEVWAILTRLQQAGTDYSGRANFIAHHLLIPAQDVGQLPSPATLFRDWTGWRKEWNEPPRYLDDQSSYSWPEQPSHPANHWAALTGDQAYAHHPGLIGTGEIARLMVRPDLPTAVILDLFLESGQSLGQRAWDFPFTTRWQKNDRKSDFRWIAGSAALLQEMGQVSASGDFDLAQTPPRLPDLISVPSAVPPSRSPKLTFAAPGEKGKPAFTPPRRVQATASKVRTSSPTRQPVSAPEPSWGAWWILGGVSGLLVLGALIWAGLQLTAPPPPEEVDLTRVIPPPPEPDQTSPTRPPAEIETPPPSTTEDPEPVDTTPSRPDPLEETRQVMQILRDDHDPRIPATPLTRQTIATLEQLGEVWEKIPREDKLKFFQEWGFAFENFLLPANPSDHLGDHLLSSPSWPSLPQLLENTKTLHLGILRSPGERTWKTFQLDRETSFRRHYQGTHGELTYVRQDESLYLSRSISEALNQGSVLIVLFPDQGSGQAFHILPPHRTTPYLYASPDFLHLDGEVLTLNNWPASFLATLSGDLRLRSTATPESSPWSDLDETPPPSVEAFRRNLTAPPNKAPRLENLQLPLHLSARFPQREENGTSATDLLAGQILETRRQIALSQSMTAYRADLESHVQRQLSNQLTARREYNQAATEFRARFGDRPTVDSFSNLRNTLEALSLQRYRETIEQRKELWSILWQAWPEDGPDLSPEKEPEFLEKLRRTPPFQSLQSPTEVAFAIIVLGALEGFERSGNAFTQTAWEALTAGREAWRRDLTNQLQSFHTEQQNLRWAEHLHHHLTASGQPFGPWEIHLGDQPLIRFD